MPIRLPPRPRDEHLDTLESTAGKLLAAGVAAGAAVVAGRALAFAHDINDLFGEVERISEETGMSPVDVGFALLGDPEAVAEYVEAGEEDGVIDVDFDVIDDEDAE